MTHTVCAVIVKNKLSNISAVQQPDGLWVETVPGSASAGVDPPVPPD